MSLESGTPASHVALAPPVTDLPTDMSNTDETVVRNTIVHPFSEGSHHASDELPTTNTALPAQESLQNALAAVQGYLSTAGCALLADAHLHGLGAVVHTTDAGTVYAYLDEGLLETVVDRVVDEGEFGATDSERVDIVQAVVLAHTMEFEISMMEANIDGEEAADWAEFTDKETDSPVGLTFSTPHPLPTLDAAPPLVERGIGLTAGIQRLTRDLDAVYGQSDVAMVYLAAYLTGNDVPRNQAYDMVSAWYDVPRECILDLVSDFAETVEEDAGLPADDPEHAYYLTSDALEEFRSLDDNTAT